MGMEYSAGYSARCASTARRTFSSSSTGIVLIQVTRSVSTNSSAVIYHTNLKRRRRFDDKTKFTFGGIVIPVRDAHTRNISACAPGHADHSATKYASFVRRACSVVFVQNRCC